MPLSGVVGRCEWTPPSLRAGSRELSSSSQDKVNHRLARLMQEGLATVGPPPRGQPAHIAFIFMNAQIPPGRLRRAPAPVRAQAFSASRPSLSEWTRSSSEDRDCRSLTKQHCLRHCRFQAKPALKAERPEQDSNLRPTP